MVGENEYKTAEILGTVTQCLTDWTVRTEAMPQEETYGLAPRSTNKRLVRN